MISINTFHHQQLRFLESFVLCVMSFNCLAWIVPQFNETNLRLHLMIHFVWRFSQPLRAIPSETLK